jgi:hypothetical protein
MRRLWPRQACQDIKRVGTSLPAAYQALKNPQNHLLGKEKIMTDLTKYARDLKRKYEDKDISNRRRMEDSGFIEGTPSMERAVKMMHKAGNSYPPDIPKLISLKAAKESPPGGSRPPSDEIGARDDAQGPDKFQPRYSEGDFGMKKGGKVNLKDCKISTHVPSKKHGNW